MRFKPAASLRMETVMNDFYEKLDGLYASGDLNSVEDFLKNAVAEEGSSAPIRASLLNELAGFYRGVSRYSESEAAFEQALAIFESIGMGATPEYATVLMNLAGLYRMRGEADKAIELFFGAMKKLEDFGARDTYAYVSVLNNLALAYQSKSDYQNAVEYASKALSLMRAGSGSEHEIATSLNNLASIYLGLADLEKAGSHISESLAIYDSMEEPDVHHAAALTTKAVLMHRLGDHQGSLNGFRRALDLTNRFFGENMEYAICKRNISEVCELLGDVDSAIQELSDAARVMAKLLGPDHVSVIAANKKLEELQKL